MQRRHVLCVLSGAPTYLPTSLPTYLLTHLPSPPQASGIRHSKQRRSFVHHRYTTTTVAKMPPDLNTVPVSPRLSFQASPVMTTTTTTTTPSRRLSHTTNMPPPALPLHSTNSAMTSADYQIPIRHPRPLTAAELHLELEKEQEAVVRWLRRVSFLLPCTDTRYCRSTA